jgi:hypothetical protein
VCAWLGGLVVAGVSGRANPPVGYALRDSGQRLGEAGDLGMDVVLGDLDRDGDLDAVVVGFGMPSRIWFNDGFGRFTVGEQSLGRNAVAVALYPESAGELRLVTADDDGGGSIRTWFRSALRRFERVSEFEFGGELPSALAVADLDGNSSLDIVLTRHGGRPAEVWVNTPARDVTGAPLSLGGRSGIKAEIGDLDRDGDPDVFLVGEEMSVWLNPGRTFEGLSGPFVQAGSAFGSGLTLGVALADLDGDGDLDAVTAGSEPEGDRVWINTGGAQAGTPGLFVDSGQRLGPGTGQSRDVAVGDMDRDGDIDAVVVRPGGNRVYWNDGRGRFTPDGLAFGAGPSEAVAVGDLNRDGVPDVVVTKFGGPAEVWLGVVPQPPTTVPEYRIEAWAGTGESGWSGDGGPALAARFKAPSDLAVDGAGVLYVVEGGGRRVRRIGLDGKVSTLVSTVGGASFGDGGPVGEAGFGLISSVAADARGNVYLAEQRNHRVRRIAPDGTVSTVAGNGNAGRGADQGVAVETMLEEPALVRIDSVGNLLVSEWIYSRVYRVDTKGFITRIAGDGRTGPAGDGGPAIHAAISRPEDLAAGSDGSLYVSEDNVWTGGHIRRISPIGIITTVAGGPWMESGGDGLPATFAGSLRPKSLALDREGNLILGQDGRIRRVDARGILAAIAGGGNGDGGDGGPALSAGIANPVEAIVRMPGGDLVFAAGHRLRRLIPTGGEIPVVPRLESAPPPGSEIDFGLNEVNSFHSWETKEIRLQNDGTADFRVRSVELIGENPAFKVSVKEGIRLAGPPPYIVQARRERDELRILVDCTVGLASPVTSRSVLRIHTDDPATPVLEYPLVARVADATSEPAEEPHEYVWESAFLKLIFRLLGAGDLKAPARSGPRLAATPDSGEVLVRLDPAQAQSVTTELPKYLGGGSVTISQFAGEVRLQVRPDPKDAGFLELTVLGGQFTAPSFDLPSGIASGPNTLTFGDPALSSGRVNRATGEYVARASATIVNSLFPRGLPVLGSYRGVYDAASGKATLRSSSADRVPRRQGLQVLRDGDGAVVTWTSTARLEAASSVLGPWQLLTNAVSPYRLEQREGSPRFYRLVTPSNR